MAKLFRILNIVALIVTIFVNYLSNTGFFNNETMSTISSKFQNLFTPAGYAFSIWGLIYLALLGFVLYYGPFSTNSDKKEKVVLNVGWWFIISCILNCLWIATWLYQYTFLSVLIMVMLFISLFKIIGNNREFINSPDPKTAIFLRLPFFIYAGWISVALIANVAAYLKKIEWTGFGIPETAWTILMIAIATSIHSYVVWKRNMTSFSFVAVWALVAIAVANKDSNNTVYIWAIICAVVIAVNSIIKILKERAVF